MVAKIIKSLKNINYKLFAALLFLGIVPAIYTTVRLYFLGQLPNEWAFSIAGQLSWINLLYEVINEAIILPLFFFMGKVKDDGEQFSNRVRTGLLLTFIIYVVMAVIIIAFTKPLLALMATDLRIIEESANYIRIESIANIFSILTQFILVVLVTINKSKYIYTFIVARLVLCLVFDTFFISTLPFSLNLGINGIGYSNIMVNVMLLIVSIYFISKEGVFLFEKKKPDFSWIAELGKIGGVSGLESLVRNFAYSVMIVRMVNVVGEQGTYWVANSFIWNWLLLPVLQLGELIKQEVAADKDNIRKNSLGYFFITASIAVLWIISIPGWKPFMMDILGFTEIEKLFRLVLILVGFYILFAFQNVFDATFYGLGKTNYMLFESLATNIIYYGSAFVLYITNKWVPTLTGIALLFGIGNAFDSIVSFIAYTYFLRKEKINILKV